MSKVRFLKAADNSRPYKSHRYDVFGLKVDRGLTLFGRGALNAWVALEADPAVLSYCERPLVIPDVKPKRVIDFWVSFRDREELWLLERSKDGTSPEQAMPAFAAWARSNGLTPRFVEPFTLTKSHLFLDNWGRIVRELTANRRFVSGMLATQILEAMSAPRPLSVLPGIFPDDDPVLTRTAAYLLLHAGKLRCTNIDQLPIGPASIVERA